jgi:hypothetical protein
MLIAAIPLYIESMYYAHADLSKLPPLQSGDLIFETAITHQTPAIIFATGSIYTHVGIVHKHQDGSYTVIHAARTVLEVPLQKFITTGWGERFTIMRYPGLTPEQQGTVAEAAEKYLGRGYNYTFYMPAKEVYCSEIPFFVFAALHIPIGTEQKISDLNVNNPAVHKLFKERWERHPACQKPGMDYATCWKTVLDEPIITPVSVERDPHLIRIYSNYLF